MKLIKIDKVFIETVNKNITVDFDIRERLQNEN